MQPTLAGDLDPDTDLTHRIVSAAVDVHRQWGRGQTQGVYEAGLCQAFDQAGLSFQRHAVLPLICDGVDLGGYVADMIVADAVILAVKAIDGILPYHHQQLRTYLRLSRCRFGLILNFNVGLMQDGIRRCIL